VSTLERVWLAYLASAIVVALLADGGGGDGHRPWAFLGLHGALLLAQLGCAWLSRCWSIRAMRVLRAGLALIGLPAVFSALAWLLPHVHPEPFEYRCYAIDVALFGGDVSQLLAAWLPALVVLGLQLSYAAFYLLPIAAALLVARERGGAAYDRTVVILVGGFLASYLGYLLVPTLAPKVVFAEAGAFSSEGLAGWLRSVIDAAEANPWDCFPSGHSWLSITSSIVVVRWARRWLPLFLPIAALVIVSTVLLRYHWPIDVLAGAALAWPVLKLCDMLLELDGAPAA